MPPKDQDQGHRQELVEEQRQLLVAQSNLSIPQHHRLVLSIPKEQ
jgi:hypothetical protein